MKKKVFVITSGKHHVANEDGTTTVFKKGDKIELTEDEAKGLVNKIIDPDAEFGVSVSNGPSVEQANAMLARIAELEAENAELKEAIDEEESED